MDAWTIAGVVAFIAICIVIVVQVRKDSTRVDTTPSAGGGTVNPRTRNEDR